MTREEHPDSNARVLFPSVEQFLAAFRDAGDAVALGDWDEDGTADSYRPARLPFDTPVLLPSSNDVLQLDYGDPRLDSKAVIYLRAALRP